MQKCVYDDDKSVPTDSNFIDFIYLFFSGVYTFIISNELVNLIYTIEIMLVIVQVHIETMLYTP